MPTATLRDDEMLQIPAGINSLDDFRRWSRSDDFPEGPRIDYIRGQIEVAIVPDDVWFHAAPKSEFVCTIHAASKRHRLGTVFTGGLRISSDDGDFSSEPDVVLLLHETLFSGRAVLVPKASKEEGRYIELTGAPDLVVEIISDSSVGKDSRRLPPAYFAAGIREFWLVDVRPNHFLFRIHHRGKAKWASARIRPDGSQRSRVLGRNYRLEQHEQPGGIWSYDLVESAE
jgi:Uma2 family endonuclease